MVSERVVGTRLSANCCFAVSIFVAVISLYETVVTEVAGILPETIDAFATTAFRISSICRSADFLAPTLYPLPYWKINR